MLNAAKALVVLITGILGILIIVLDVVGVVSGFKSSAGEGFATVFVPPYGVWLGAKATMSSLATTRDPSQSSCEAMIHGATTALLAGNVITAKRQLLSARESKGPTRCTELSTTVLAALIVAESQTYKTIAIQSDLALHDRSLSDDIRGRWELALEQAMSNLSLTLADGSEALEAALTIKRKTEWDLPAEELIPRMEEVLSNQEEANTNLQQATWNPKIITPDFQADYTFVSFLTNCNEYWNSKDRLFDVAGILCDWGTTLLFTESYEKARVAFDRVRQLTADDLGSPWRAKANYGLSEARKRQNAKQQPPSRPKSS